MPCKENRTMQSIHSSLLMLFLSVLISVADIMYQHKKPSETQSNVLVGPDMCITSGTGPRAQIYSYLIYTCLPRTVSKDIYDSKVIRSKSDANPYTLFQGKLSPTNILKNNKYIGGGESREPVKTPFFLNESFLSVDIRQE